MEQKVKASSIIKWLYIVLSFMMVDFWLRFLTRELGLYNITELAPNAFTILWSIILTLIIFLLKRKIGRVLYGIIYYIFAIYSIVQYVYYLIFGKFLFFSDFLFAGEGANYIGYILAVLTPSVIIQIVILLLIGLVGIILFPQRPTTSRKRIIINLTIILLSVVGIVVAVPKLYDFSKDSSENIYRDEAFEYKRFVNSAFDMQLTGVYQYVAKDAGNNINKLLFYKSSKAEAFDEIENYFKDKEVKENAMTGIFKDKNVIIVMMESIDDWLITEEDMPTVYYMMNHGINFTNIYTPNYSSGYTVNTEFAFNTSIYPLSTENYVHTLTDNEFNNSIANVFASNGYSVNSYHYNTPEFYNRGVLHPTLGYEKYFSFFEYSNDIDQIIDDRFIYSNDELYNDLINPDKTNNSLFMSFVITNSAHLPYVTGYSRFAEEYYGEDYSEEAIIRAKAHVTDDMFKGLLQRLENDGLLKDTVIVGFSDHYAYGLNDRELLEQLSAENGSSILERTAAFIYCADMEEQIIVDKVSQTTDLAPTIENLLGLSYSKYSMGNDVFDETYEGYAIFMNNTWITNVVYMKDGVIIYNKGASTKEVEEMNEFVKQTYKINDYLLEYDFYNGK